jgi:predicted dehydrogenase
MKVIEALEYLKAVASGTQHHPGFSDALAVASVLDAMTRSWRSEQWESVVDLTIP